MYLRCRSCMCKLLKSTCHAVNKIGWKSLTLKQMFEMSLNHEILNTEPQQFCFGCTQTLIEWHKFKEVCQRTQDSLVSVNLEPEPEAIWYVNDAGMKFETEEEASVNHEPELNVTTETEELKLQFSMFSREFCQQKVGNCICLGMLEVKGTCVEELQDKIWLNIRPHLKREIIFNKDDPNPVWHQDEFPKREKLDQFIIFLDPIAKQSYVCPTFEKMKSWRDRKIILFVYPYSKNIVSVSQMKMARMVLIDSDQSPSKPNNEEKSGELSKMPTHSQVTKKVTPEISNKPQITDVCIPEDTSNYPHVFKFQAYTRQFKNQRDKAFLANFNIAGHDIKEIKHNIWLAVKPHIVREICFTNTWDPFWSSEENPQEHDLSKFIDFTYSAGRKLFKLDEIFSKSNIDELILNIYPYTSAVNNANLWEKVKTFLSPPVLVETKVDNRINSLVETLKKNHETAFFNVNNAHWRMWAHYIDCFEPERQEKLLLENPPSLMLPFFDATHIINSSESNDSSEPVKYSFEVLAHLKEARDQNVSLFLGRLRFQGNTVDEVKHSIWKKVRPYLIRDAFINDNGIPMWSDQETPTEDDLDKFTLIYDAISKRIYTIASFTEDRIYRWNDKQDLKLEVYQFPTSIRTKEALTCLKSLLFDSKSGTWKETLKLMKLLKGLHAEKFESLKSGWRMWAHYIQGHENLIRENPPKELLHLFFPVSHRDQYKNTLAQIVKEKRDRKEAEVKKTDAVCINKKLKINPQDVPDKTRLKQCPFEGCSSVIQIQSFARHFKICRFNPDRKFLFHCPSEGCNRSFSIGSLYESHVRNCKFNPRREIKPTHQCPHCPALVTNLKQHMLLQHSTKKFVCDLCGEAKRSKENLKRHINYIHNKVTIQCDRCPLAFKTQKTLRLHLARDHSDKPLETLQCDKCAYQTHDRANLVRHFKHNHDPNYIKPTCPECGKVFKGKQQLGEHLLTHANTEFTCEICGHVSKTKRGLKSHKTLHAEWKYECPVCFIKRRSANEVRMHCKRKHPKYQLPTKGTILKKTSRFHGKKIFNY